MQNYEFPSYPPAARALQAEGLVLIFVEVSKAGKILNATAIGHPLLRAVSEAAARSWKFSPNLYESYLTLRFVFNSHPGRYDSGQKIVTGPYGIQITAERVLLDF
ncbi:MAG: energy transducer TonB [Acidobacteriota bacterium]